MSNPSFRSRRSGGPRSERYSVRSEYLVEFQRSPGGRVYTRLVSEASRAAAARLLKRLERRQGRTVTVLSCHPQASANSSSHNHTYASNDS